MLGAGYRPISWLGYVGETDLFVAEREGREVLVKHLSRTHRRFDALRRQMLEEGRLAAELHHHNLVAFRAAHDTRTGLSLVFDHPGGVNVAQLTDRLGERGEAVPFDVAVHITLEAARATARVRARTNVPVRSLQPEHVLVTDRGIVMLATHRLGLIRLAVVQEESRDPDVFELGRLLFTMLVGEAPRADVPPTLSILAEEEVPDELVTIVRRATYGHDYDDVERVVADLEAWQKGGRRSVEARQIATLFWENGLLSEDVVRLLPPPSDGAGAIEAASLLPPPPVSNEFEDGPRTIAQSEWEAAMPPARLIAGAVRVTPVPQLRARTPRHASDVTALIRRRRRSGGGPPPVPTRIVVIEERALDGQVEALFDEQPPSFPLDPRDLISDLDEADVAVRPTRWWFLLGIIAFVIAGAITIGVVANTAPPKLVGTQIVD